MPEHGGTEISRSPNPCLDVGDSEGVMDDGSAQVSWIEDEAFVTVAGTDVVAHDVGKGSASGITACFRMEMGK